MARRRESPDSAVATLDLGERRPDERLDHGLELQAGAARFAQQPQTFGIQRGAMSPVDLGEQAILAAEVVADERPVHACLGGNHSHRDAGEAAFGEQPFRGGQELLAGLGGGWLRRPPSGSGA